MPEAAVQDANPHTAAAETPADIASTATADAATTAGATPVVAVVVDHHASGDKQQPRQNACDEEEEALSDGDVAELQGQLRQAVAGGDADAAYHEPALYYDADTMAPLNAFSAAAIARLRAYKPPAFPLWDRLSSRRRAAVLVLLYADQWGDLRVVITMRAASLRSFSGHAALPGGKADNPQETPYRIARREAYEEIGLPMDDARIPKPFRIEQLCCLPPLLARTHLIVTPCVAFLHADRPAASSASASAAAGPPPSVEDSMIPRLDAREVAAVFSAPFYNFLKARDLPPRPGATLPPGRWYDGEWIKWKDVPWRVHNFYVPVSDQRVARPRRGSAQSNLAGRLEKEQEHEGRFKVWGMTGRLLVDAARIAYAEDPEVEHNADYGDTNIINRADAEGSFSEAGEQPQPQQQRDGDGEPAKM